MNNNIDSCIKSKVLAICDFHNTFSILDPKVQPKEAADLLVPPGQFPGLFFFVGHYHGNIHCLLDSFLCQRSFLLHMRKSNLIFMYFVYMIYISVICKQLTRLAWVQWIISSILRRKKNKVSNFLRSKSQLNRHKKKQKIA